VAKKASNNNARHARPKGPSTKLQYRTRLSLGDVIEFKTITGLVYAQYVFNHTKAQAYGELFRIIEGCFPHHKMSAGEIAQRKTLYVCFCHPQPEIKSGRSRIIGNAEIPKEVRSLPLFKWAFRNIISGRVIRWETWDGSTRKGRQVTRLTKAEKKYPLLEIVTLDAIISRLEANWNPEDECKPGATSVFGSEI
jgi:hypothetical protein